MTTGDFTSGFAEQQLAEGNTYRTGFYETGLSQGDTRRVTITNPQDSDVTLLLRPTKISGEMSMVIRPAFVQSVDSEGDDLDAIQLNGHSNNTPTGDPRLGDNVTTGQEFPPEFIPSADPQGGNVGAGKDGMSSAAIAAPGQVATQQIEYLGSGRSAFNFNWVEVQNGLVPAVEQQ